MKKNKNTVNWRHMYQFDRLHRNYCMKLADYGAKTERRCGLLSGHDGPCEFEKLNMQFPLGFELANERP